MQKAAKYVLSTYVPPIRKDVRGCLLLENYRDYITTTTKNSLLMLGYLDLQQLELELQLSPNKHSFCW